MDLWQAIILGLVEGITEYLPISSTGHLILVSSLLGLDDPATKGSVDAFNIIIQGGAILAVLGLYRTRVLCMIVGMLGAFRIGKGDAAGLRLAINILIAFMPAAVLGVLLNDWIEERLFLPMPVLLALGVGGLYMMALDRWKLKKFRDHDPEHDDKIKAAESIEGLTPLRALSIGFMQVIAMWPGTSRSMMTITGGVLVGLKPKDAAEFSFLLGLPTLGGACVYSLAKDLKRASETGGPNVFEALGGSAVAVGLLTATISAAFAVRWLVSFLNKHGLFAFGVYRLILCAAVAGLWMAGLVSIGGEPDETPTIEPTMIQAPKID